MSRARPLSSTLVAAALVTVMAACGTSAPRSDAEVRRAVSERFLACSEAGSLVLLAQSVPTATFVPCVESYPPGWVLEGVPVVRSGFGSFSLSSDIAGTTAVTVTITRNCDVTGALHRNDLGTPDTQRWFEYLGQPSPATGYNLLQYYRFIGGCVTYHYVFQPGTPGTFVGEVDAALGFVPRADVAAFVKEQFGQTLCGPPPDTCVP